MERKVFLSNHLFLVLKFHALLPFLRKDKLKLQITKCLWINKCNGNIVCYYKTHSKRFFFLLISRMLPLTNARRCLWTKWKNHDNYWPQVSCCLWVVRSLINLGQYYSWWCLGNIRYSSASVTFPVRRGIQKFKREMDWLVVFMQCPAKHKQRLSTVGHIIKQRYY